MLIVKWGFRNNKSIFLAPVNPEIAPLEIPLANRGDAFWLDDHTIGHVVSGAASSSTSSSAPSPNQASNSASNKAYELYVISVKLETENARTTIKAPSSPVLVGSFPEGVTPSNFKYVSKASKLLFSAYVFPDGDLTTVKGQSEAYEARGNTALVYDETYERHWDTWVGPKRSQLFTVGLTKTQIEPQAQGQEAKWKWVLADEWGSPMKGLDLEVPVEPFGGTDDFDVDSEGKFIIFTSKDPDLPMAMHTRQNVSHIHNSPLILSLTLL